MGFDVNDVPSFGRQAAYLYGMSAPNEVAPQPVDAQKTAGTDGNAVAEPAADGYNADLARILRNVSRETWKTIGSDDIKALFELSKDDGVRVRLQKLNETVAKVQSSLAKLAKYKAGDVGAALATGNGDASELLKAAVDGLFDISNELCAIGNGCDSDAFRYACDDLGMLCDSRASELMTLGEQMAAIADNPDVLKGYDQLKEGNFVDITKGMGGVMHDNYEAVSKTGVKNDSVEKLMQDLEVKGQSADPKDVDKETVDALEKRIAKLGNAISAGGSRGVLTQEAAERIRATFGEMSHRTRIGAEYGRRFIESQRIPFADILKGADAKACPLLTRMNEAQEKWHAALRKVTDEKPGTKAHKHAAEAALKQATEYSKFIYGLFGKAAKESGRLNVDSLKAELNSIIDRDPKAPAAKKAKALRDVITTACADARSLGHSPLQTVGKAIYGCHMGHYKKDEWVKELLKGQLYKVKTYTKEDRAGSLSDVVKSIFNKTGMSKPLLAALYDVGADYIDDTLTDDMVFSAKIGASGTASMTEIVTYRTDDPSQPTKEIVFKPDFIASFNDKTLNLSFGGAYGREQGPRPLHLGIATYEFGKLLGCSDVVIKTTPLFRNGQLGLGMEKAPGKEASLFSGRTGAFELERIGAMARSKDPKERARFRKNANDVTSKTTAMQWTDLMCGQCDRHGGNFMVGFDGDDVSVKMIDNDMSFGLNRVGLTKMKLSEVHINELVYWMDKCVRSHASEAKPKLDEKTLKTRIDKWVRSQLKDGVLDYASQDYPVEFKHAIKKAIGVTALMVPKVMSRKMADNILALAENDGEGFKAFCKQLVDGRLIASTKDNDAYVEDCLKATTNRFNEIVELIKGGKLILVDEPTEDNPTPWLDEKVVAAVKGEEKEYCWVDSSMAPEDVGAKFREECKDAKRLGAHPVYRFETLLDANKLSASMKAS